MSFSKERLFLINLLSKENIVKSIKENFERLVETIPEIKNMVGFEHNHPHHHLNVWDHTLYALSLAPNDYETRLVLLLHDIGKPVCYQEEDNGIRHFKGHAEKSAQISKNILARIGFEYNYAMKICKLIKLHDTPLTEQEILDSPKLSHTRFIVQKCDALAHNPEKNEKRLKYLEKIEQIFNSYDNMKKQ